MSIVYLIDYPVRPTDLMKDLLVPSKSASDSWQTPPCPGAYPVGTRLFPQGKIKSAGLGSTGWLTPERLAENRYILICRPEKRKRKQKIAEERSSMGWDVM